MQLLQPNWSVKPSAIAGGLVSGASGFQVDWSVSVQRFQADWSGERAALAAELVSEAFSACRCTGQSSVQRLQADSPVERAALTGGFGLAGLACNHFRRTGRSSVQR